jgi:hypothetical protein
MHFQSDLLLGDDKTSGAQLHLYCNAKKINKEKIKVNLFFLSGLAGLNQ